MHSVPRMSQRDEDLELIYHMMELTGYSLSALATASRLSTTTLTRYVNSETVHISYLTPDTKEKLATCKNEEGQQFYSSYEDYIIKKNSALPTVPVIGRIVDGGHILLVARIEIVCNSRDSLKSQYEIMLPSKIKLDRVPAPPPPRGKAKAKAIIVEEDLCLAIPAGSTVYINEEDIDGLDIGKYLRHQCCVGTKSGEILVRILLPGTNGKFSLQTLEGKVTTDVELVWAAPIIFSSPAPLK